MTTPNGLIFKNKQPIVAKEGWPVNGRRAVSSFQMHYGISEFEMSALLRAHGYDANLLLPRAMEERARPLYAVNINGKEMLGYIHCNQTYYFEHLSGVRLPADIAEMFKNNPAGGFVELGADVRHCLLDGNSAVFAGSKLSGCTLLSTVVNGAQIIQSTYMDGQMLYAPPANGDSAPQRVVRI